MARFTRRALGLAALTLAAVVPAAPAAAQGCAGAGLMPNHHNADRVASATLCLVNRERTSRGLAALAGDGRLERAARRHSADMVSRRYFDHASPAGDTLFSRASAAHYIRSQRSLLAENLGWGSGSFATPAHIVRAWMASPGHRTNILSPWARDAGVGVDLGTPVGLHGATYTLDFGRAR